MRKNKKKTIKQLLEKMGRKDILYIFVSPRRVSKAKVLKVTIY